MIEVSPLTCTPEELYHVVSTPKPAWLLLALSNPGMSEDHVVSLLRNPAVTPQVISEIADRLDWLSSYKIQFALVNCPKSPHQLALRLLQAMFWNDLLKIAANYRLNPRLRHTAENYLKEKAVSLTPGEKKTLARSAPRGMIGYLRKETERDVFRALLQNPKLVEEDLLIVVNDDTTPTVVLEAICSDFRWSFRYPIRLALVRNHRTPLRFALAYLSKLKPTDLQMIVRSPRTPELVRRCAQRLLDPQSDDGLDG